jgi:hypothetical protein
VDAFLLQLWLDTNWHKSLQMNSRNREYLTWTLCAGFYKLSNWTRNSSIPKEDKFSPSSIILALSMPMIHSYSELCEARRDIFSVGLYAQTGTSHQWISLVPLLAVNGTTCNYTESKWHYKWSDFVVKHVGFEWKLLSWLSVVLGRLGEGRLQYNLKTFNI